MMRALISAVFFTILMAVLVCPALAQNELGLFFDAEGTSSTLTTSAPYSQVPIWVQLVNPDASEAIHGFEFRLEMHTDGPDPVVQWQLPAQSLNILEAPSFMVGLGTPLAIAERLTLLQAIVVVPEAGQTIWFTVHPLEQPSFLDPPGYGYPVCHPAYSVGADNSFVAMFPNSGCESEPVAAINPDGQPPLMQFSELPEMLFIQEDKDHNPAFALIVTNPGPVSISGVLRLTGSSPVQISLDGNYFTEGPIDFQIPVGGTIRVVPECATGSPYDAELQLEICGSQWSVPIVDEYFLYSCRWSEEVLDFGESQIGAPVYQDVILTNDGFRDLDIPYGISLNVFHLSLVGNGDSILMPGESCTYQASFLPNGPGEFQATAMVEERCSLQLIGIGIDGPPQCEISVSEVDFGEVPIGGYPGYQFIRVQNIGGGILSGSFELLDSTGAFRLQYTGSPDFTLTYMQSRVCYVYFEPTAVGQFEAQLELGSHCESVQLSGIGTDPDPECQLYSELWFGGAFDIDPVPVGGTTRAMFHITNIGGGLLQGHLSLDDTTGVFEILGEPEYSVPPGHTRYVYLNYTPRVVGQDTTMLHTGSSCGDFMVTSFSTESYADCHAGMYGRNFDRVAVGDTTSVYFYIYNTGYMELEGDLAVTGDGFFLENPGPFVLPAQRSQYENLMFIPSSVGEFSATVTTGLDYCPGDWEVSGFSMPAGSDQMGFYFDEEGNDNTTSTEVPKVTKTAYLVLKNPWAEGQLTQWYTNHWTNGPVVVMDDWITSLPGEIQSGPYEKRLYLDTPVPFAETMVLAEFSIMVTSPSEASLVNSGYAYYRYYDGNDAQLAFIQNPGDLFINSDKSMMQSLPPEPVVQIDGHQVELAWPCGDEDFEGFNVYRRVDQGIPERLNPEPMFCEESEAHFTDTTLPFLAEVAYYNLTALHAGQESLPGPEFTLVLLPEPDPLPLPIHTGLLSIYPNPFNPETNISFELAEAGLVQIRIFDLSGRLVRTLVDRQFDAGRFEEVWNGRDDAGRTLPSNVYYARLSSGSVVQMMKMTLLK